MDGKEGLWKHAESTVERNEPRLLDQLRDAIRIRHYSIRTEETYVHWVLRYVKHHHLRHPREMGAPQINAFLTYLAVHDNVTASTQNHRVKGFAPRG